jgi:hypothetical protein
MPVMPEYTENGLGRYPAESISTGVRWHCTPMYYLNANADHSQAGFTWIGYLAVGCQ